MKPLLLSVFSFIRTLEPDGTATGCNPVEVGSTPTGVFNQQLKSVLKKGRVISPFPAALSTPDEFGWSGVFREWVLSRRFTRG